MDFEELDDPDLRCWAMAGFFLNTWAVMEADLNAALGKALGLSEVQQAIVTHNINLRDKINILRTCVDLALMKDDEKKLFKKELQNLGTYSTVRNMVAHDMFDVSEDRKGISFVVIKAKGSLEIPDVSWSLEDLREHIGKILGYQKLWKHLKSRLIHADIVRALMSAERSKPPEPMGGLFGLASDVLLGRQPQEPQSSATNPANPTEAPQTPHNPPAPEEPKD